MLSLYTHEFHFHRKCSADIPPIYGDKSDSYLSAHLAYYQTDEKFLSGEKHFPHKQSSIQTPNIGKQSKGFQQIGQ